MKTILLLEDEPALMNLVRRMLAPYSVLEAATAAEALRQFQQHGQVDLLIADVSLPVSSGIQVALLLRAENPHLAIILASGYPTSNWDEKDLGDLARLGPGSVAVLQKPFSTTVLRERVAALIGAPSTLSAGGTSAIE